MTTYWINQFDGLELPLYIPAGQSDNMGTGEALQAFTQIPGGFFDNYGTRRSPQGIRPIVVNRMIIATSAANLQTQIDGLRGKIGVRGKLSANFPDDSIRWQWARLVSCDIPSEAEQILSAPVRLEFVTASQLWNGIITTPTEWTWGDETWVFGDGTAEFGESGTTETITANTGGTQAFTVTHNGNLTATNIVITVTAGTSDVDYIYYDNATTQSRIVLVVSGASGIETGKKLVVNAAERSAWYYEASTNIASAAMTDPDTVRITTSSVHGLTIGDTVRISGGTPWDGVIKNVNVTSTTKFSFESNTYSTLGAVGTVEEVRGEYAIYRTNNDDRWPTLAPGDNAITITVADNSTGDATIGWEYYEHFA